METETVLVSEVIPAPAGRVFSAWIDSSEHSSFTGDKAEVQPYVGGFYSAFDGYITGVNLSLEKGRKIVQSWRSTEFPSDCPDSHLEVTLEETQGGTLVTLLHSGIPAGQADELREGWIRHYLEPLKKYFKKGAHAARHEARPRRKS